MSNGTSPITSQTTHGKVTSASAATVAQPAVPAREWRPKVERPRVSDLSCTQCQTVSGHWALGAQRIWALCEPRVSDEEVVRDEDHVRRARIVSPVLVPATSAACHVGSMPRQQHVS